MFNYQCTTKREKGKKHNLSDSAKWKGNPSDEIQLLFLRVAKDYAVSTYSLMHKIPVVCLRVRVKFRELLIFIKCKRKERNHFANRKEVIL